MQEQPELEHRVSLESALARLRDRAPDPFASVFTHGTLEVELYAPRGSDDQTPHTQDELYVVVQGSGMFMNDGKRAPFGPGDVLFVPAGVDHRFEEFTPDFLVWVIFYGPEGGERR